MIFIAGLPKQHFNDVIKAAVSSVPGEIVTGLPAIGGCLLTPVYVAECLDTLKAFHAGRPGCFERGLSIIGVSQVGESFAELSASFYPFALTREARFPRAYSFSPAQSRRDKNELVRLVVADVKRQVKLKNEVNRYLQSRSNRTPMLLPLRHFGEAELEAAVRQAWNQIPSVKSATSALDEICKLFEKKFPFSKKASSKAGNFSNSKDIWFATPGRELHATVHAEAVGHAVSCFFNGVLRVGGAIREGFHYDCTKRGARHSGTFANCHDGYVKRSGKPHLNVYPNDYIR